METSPRDQLVSMEQAKLIFYRQGLIVRYEVEAMQEPILADLASLGGGATEQQYADVVRKHITDTFDRIAARMRDVIDQAANSAPLA